MHGKGGDQAKEGVFNSQRINVKRNVFKQVVENDVYSSSYGFMSCAFGRGAT